MSPPLPENERALAPLRAEIDAIDRELVALLARRLGVVEKVIAVKRAEGIAALLPERIEDVVTKVRAQAQANGTPPDLAETLWRAMIEWVVAYEEERLG
ncbi:chorismate mutase [Ancylobacter terrae]|uniref:chorismate mutase n=1 Tax=Ancylobacter sp. sgz301288 TaxID=3342077 RepID=UPI0038580CC2